MNYLYGFVIKYSSNYHIQIYMIIRGMDIVIKFWFELLLEYNLHF